MMQRNSLHMVSFVLVMIGGINWGLVGLFDLNVVNLIFGAWPWLERIIYVLVGAAAVWLLVQHKTECKICGGMTAKDPSAFPTTPSAL